MVSGIYVLLLLNYHLINNAVTIQDMKKFIPLNHFMFLLLGIALSACNVVGNAPDTVTPVGTNEPTSTIPTENIPVPSLTPTSAVPAYLGGWTITNYQSAPISAMSPEDASAWIGKTAMLAPELLFFDRNECFKPQYSTTETTLNEYLADFKTDAGGINLKDGEVTRIKTQCADSIFADFIRMDPQTLLVNQDGTFFILQPRSAASNGGIALQPISEFKGNASPKYTITIIRPQAVDASAAALNDLIAQKIQKRLGTFLSDMVSWQVPPEMKDQASEFDINYQIFNNQQGVVSILFFQFIYYAGAAHPNTNFFVMNFDLNTQKEIQLSDLFQPGSAYLAALSSASEKQLSKKDFPLFKDGYAPLETNFQNWNLRQDRLILNFEPYQVAAYAVGPQTVEIPLSELKAILSNQIP
jgi:hypothetical protein